MTQAKERLLELLRKHSYREGTFTLASGRESDFYIDCKQTFLRREGLWLAAAVMSKEALNFDEWPVAVAGEGVGGIPLAAAIAMCTGFIHPIFVRKTTKDHGTEQKVERARDVIRDGSKVVLVEDVLTTGGSALRAVNALRADGLHVLGVLALVDWCEGAHVAAKEGRVEMASLFTRDDFVGATEG